MQTEGRATEPMPIRRARWGLAAAASVAAVAARAVVLPDGGFPLDDAYITLHSAGVLWAGHDPNYDVPALVGITSPVHLALVAALMAVLPPVSAAEVAGALAVAAYACGLVALAGRVDPRSRWLPAFTLMVGLGTGYAPFQLANGLETGWAMAAVTWALVLANGAPGPVLPLMCGALPFLRPELGVLGVLLLVRQVLLRGDTRHAAADVALAALAAAPWLAWQLASTGSPLPATGTAKMLYYAEAALPAVIRVRLTATALLGSGIGLAWIGFAGLPRRQGLAAVAWASTLALVGVLGWTFPGGLAHVHARYLYPLLPLATFGLARLVTAGTVLSRPLVVASAFAGLVFVPGNVTSLRENTRLFSAHPAELAAWASTALPPDARVLVHDAGYFAFATDLRLVDVVGLKTPDAIEAHRRFTAPSAGTERWRAVADIALDHAVTHAVVLRDGGGFSTVADGLRRAGWTLTLLRSAPDGALGYDVFALEPPR